MTDLRPCSPPTKNGYGQNARSRLEELRGYYIVLFLVKSHLLDADVGAIHFEVKVHAVGSCGSRQVTDAILIAVFATLTFVHLCKSLGFVIVEKTFEYFYCFGFWIYLLFVLNGNFHVIGKVFRKCVYITSTQGW